MVSHFFKYSRPGGQPRTLTFITQKSLDLQIAVCQTQLRKTGDVYAPWPPCWGNTVAGQIGGLSCTRRQAPLTPPVKY